MSEEDVFVEGKLTGGICGSHLEVRLDGQPDYAARLIYLHRDQIHHTLPKQEPEWQEGELMNGFKAMYLSQKHNLDILLHRRNDDPIVLKLFQVNSHGLEELRFPTYSLRKPVSAKDKLRSLIHVYLTDKDTNSVMNDIEAAGLLREDA